MTTREQLYYQQMVAAFTDGVNDFDTLTEDMNKILLNLATSLDNIMPEDGSGGTIDAATVLSMLKTVDGEGSGLDADTLRTLLPGNGPDNVLKLDSTGKVPADNLPATEMMNVDGGTF